MRTQIKGKDEIASLGEAFNYFLDTIESDKKQIADYSKNLETMVAEKTAQITRILANVQFGFLLIDKSLTVQEGYTKSCSDLLGPKLKANTPIAEALKLSKRESSHYSSCLTQVFDDIMPEEVTMGQAPTEFQIDDKILQVKGKPVRDEKENIEFILFSITDITQLQQAQSTNLQNQALISILQQRDAFARFLMDFRKLHQESWNMLEKQSQQGQIRMNLHTIKGNAGVFGLNELSHTIHEVEDHSTISKEDLSNIENELKTFLAKNSAILKITYESDCDDNYAVPAKKLDYLNHLAKENKITDETRIEILKWIYEVKKKPAQDVFGYLEDLVNRTAMKLFKEVQFKFIGSQTKVDPDILQPLTHVLPHIIRNSVDHGIEEPGMRGAKDATGTITLNVSEEDNYNWLITISDDGQGINVDKLKEKAHEKGLYSEKAISSMSTKEAFQLLFQEDISTASEISEVSGRGVGMAAVKSSILAMHGSISVHSTLGKGSEFVIRIPKRKVAPDIAARTLSA